MRSLTPARAAGAGLLLAVIALSVLYLIPSDKYYVFLPDRAHPLQPLVSVAGERPAAREGGVTRAAKKLRLAQPTVVVKTSVPVRLAGLPLFTATKTGTKALPMFVKPSYSPRK